MCIKKLNQEEQNDHELKTSFIFPQYKYSSELLATKTLNFTAAASIICSFWQVSDNYFQPHKQKLTTVMAQQKNTVAVILLGKEILSCVCRPLHLILCTPELPPHIMLSGFIQCAVARRKLFFCAAQMSAVIDTYYIFSHVFFVLLNILFIQVTISAGWSSICPSYRYFVNYACKGNQLSLPQHTW